MRTGPFSLTSSWCPRSAPHAAHRSYLSAHCRGTVLSPYGQPLAALPYPRYLVSFCPASLGRPPSDRQRSPHESKARNVCCGFVMSPLVRWNPHDFKAALSHPSQSSEGGFGQGRVSEDWQDGSSLRGFSSSPRTAIREACPRRAT